MWYILPFIISFLCHTPTVGKEGKQPVLIYNGVKINGKVFWKPKDTIEIISLLNLNE